MAIRVVQAGIGGYGRGYVEALLAGPPSDLDVAFVGAVDPAPRGAEEAAGPLADAGVPLYPDFEAFFAEREADLAVLATPIALHAPQTCDLLGRGLTVLCEKPMAATVQEGLRMIEAEERAEGFAAVGFQLSFHPAVQALKRDVLAGRFGRPVRMRTVVLWPRNRAYYARNAWAGRVKDDAGRWVLDSPVMNATAHFLHNALYVIGAAREASAAPATLEAELYRANAIESFDTGALRVRTTEGVEVLYLASHAVDRWLGPRLEYEFEEATVAAERVGQEMVFEARFADGRTERYDTGAFDVKGHKLWESARAVAGGPPVACSVRTALPHLVCACAAFDACGEIADFPAEMVAERAHERGPQTYARGLSEAILGCYEARCLPSELGGLEWARPGRELDLEHYTWFPGGTPPTDWAKS